MAPLAWITNVFGLDYDNIKTQAKNLAVRAITTSPGPIAGSGNGVLFGFKGLTSRASGSTIDTLMAAFGMSEELLTIAAAATTDSVNNLLPANSLILGVVVRVVTAIPTATTFSVGDATTAARFMTGIAVALNTTGVSSTQWNPANTTLASGPQQAAAAKIRITPSATPASATGQVRIQVSYIQFTPPPA